MLVGVGGIATLVHCGRRSAELTAEGDHLTIELNQWFRVRRFEWNRKDLRSPRVDVREVGHGESETRFVTTLRVQPKAGKPVKILRYLRKAELEWVASTFRDNLHLSS